MRTTFKAGVCSFLGIATLIIIVLVGYIVSCFLDNQILNEDMSFSLNYNNISAGYSSYWVANSRVYFSDNVGYLYPYYEITKEGKEKIDYIDQKINTIENFIDEKWDAIQKYNPFI